MSESSNLGDQLLHVLLVERHPETVSAITLMFSEIKECRLEVCFDYEQALDRISSLEHDIVLFSHGLGGTSGLDILSRSLENHPSAHTVVFLPSTEHQLADQYRQAGVKDFAFPDKNFISGLMRAVRKALVRIVDRKAFLLASVAGTSFFPEGDDSADLLPVSTLEAGQTILHYHIIGRIGEGGMGQIYEAEDEKLGRRVAIKILPPRVTKNEIARKRLIREARLASGLNHPNIVTIYSIEEWEDVSFIVMEYVQGESLFKRLHSGPIKLESLIDIAIQTADALNAAHGAGLIHRDIKPGNIMLSQRGQAKLLDFGLAKSLQLPGDKDRGLTNLTGIGVPVGTISYMSPEQTRGEELDARSDIFSLGAVLYEAATGKLPFDAPSTLGVLHEIATTDPVAPGKLVSSLPQDFDQIVRRAMAKDKEERYSSISDLADDLRKLKLTMDKSLSDSSPALKTKRTSTREPQEKQGRIFLVEDNEENRDMLSRRLQRKGFDVLIAASAEEAIQRIPQEKPDLVLMDISLPVMDGYEATRRLKGDPASKAIPIIALTAHAMAGDREKALAAGCNDYDTKPVDFERLMKKVVDWLGKKPGTTA